ncbi:LysE family translocator [Pararhodospirillum oryzae]|uniref:Lysine transporter LysE n=1 Tax=Pararhodospirillum oryzae TaxID=478448 RepID=A0A512HB55_9PROT|nr:LysE family translocator [Pararhodospirillum oryzae]GEO82665.1 lysine transporter LysE [Pararhodospirillum oryzae]
MISPEFLLTSLVVALIPGTGVLYTLTMGLAGGARQGAIAAVGCTLGIVPHLLAAVLGVAAVLHASALAFQGLKILGVAFLLYMAWGLWRDKNALRLDEGPRVPARARTVIGRGIALNLLNPKLSVFFLAFLPQFVPAQAAGGTLTMTVLGLVFMFVTLVVFVMYGLFAARVREALLMRPRVVTWLRRTMAGMFVLFGVRLALSER